MAPRRCVLTVSCVLAACGGGGGGGDNAPAGGNPPPPAFHLTELTALEAGSYALVAVEEALLSVIATTVTALELSHDDSPPQGFCNGQPVAQTYDDRDLNGTVSVGDTVRFQHSECFGLARNYALTLGAFNPSSGTYEGALDFTTSLGAVSITGGLAASLTVHTTGDIRVRASNAVATITSSGTQQTVRFTASELTLAQNDTYAWTMTGGNVDSAALGGSYAFATSGAFLGNRRRLPSSGGLVLSTASGSRVSIMAARAPVLGEATVDYAAAAPGGTFGEARQGLWTSLLRGWLFNWSPNSPPTLSNLAIQPEFPGAGEPVSVYFNAFDLDGDPLTIEIQWRHNGEVLADSSTLFPRTTARNDVVEVTVSVSDGRELTPTVGHASVTIDNRAPVLTSLSITPAQPDTTDDLVAMADVFDPDGDPLEASYVWYRNQTVVEGQTGPVFPASLTTRGDFIAVTATFRDDGFSDSLAASVTVGDAGPRVAVGASPTAVIFGTPTAFMASVSDPDGDPVDELRFELAYGPAGMSVDPVTGVVTWTPSGPMFNRTLDVHWAVTVGALGARAATGTTRVEDPTRAYPLLRTGVQVPMRGALRVDDFDGDGDTEMLLLGTRALLEVEFDGTSGYREAWAYPFVFDPDDVVSPYGTYRTVVTGDVDGDGRHEIFVSTDRGLLKLDGNERRVVASASLREDERCTDLAYGDLDRNGSPEIVCAALELNYYERLIVFDAADLSERNTLPQGVYGTQLAIGNVDADPALEIVTSAGLVIDGVTFASEWQVPRTLFAFATGDIDGAAPDEIVAQTGYTELAAFRVGDSTPLFTTADEPSDALFIADIDGDARAEILSGEDQWGNVTAYRYDTATGMPEIVFQINSQNHGVTAFGVGNLDMDAALEIVWGAGMSSGMGQLVVAEHSGQIEWLASDPVRLLGPFGGGALAQSTTAAPAPLFVAPSDEGMGAGGTRLVRLDPDDGVLEIGGTIDDEANFTQFTALTVRDYDADGTDEALLAGEGFFSAPPTVYDFFTDTAEWRMPDQWARQLRSGNVVDDARDELVWADEAGVVYVLDVATEQLIWQSEPLNEPVDVRLADLDGDGYAEIVASTSSTIVTFERAPVQTFQIGGLYQSAFPVVDVIAADTDGDDVAEIFALLDTTSEPASQPARVLRFDDRLQFQSQFELPWRGRSLAIEASPFDRKNLLVTYVEGVGGRLATVDARTGGMVSESPPLLGGITRDSIHYVELDQGPVRLSIGTEYGMYLAR